ncbi:MAG: hypothetical protein ACOZAO_04280 [Patescibacteria group bacterium]
MGFTHKVILLSESPEEAAKGKWKLKTVLSFAPTNRKQIPLFRGSPQQCGDFIAKVTSGAINILFCPQSAKKALVVGRRVKIVYRKFIPGRGLQPNTFTVTIRAVKSGENGTLATVIPKGKNAQPIELPFATLIEPA